MRTEKIVICRDMLLKVDEVDVCSSLCRKLEFIELIIALNPITIAVVRWVTFIICVEQM